MGREKDPRRAERNCVKYFGGELVSVRERRAGNKKFMHHDWLNAGVLLDHPTWRVLRDALDKVARVEGENDLMSMLILANRGIRTQNHLVVMRASDVKDLHIGQDYKWERPVVVEVEREEVQREDRADSSQEFLGWSGLQLDDRRTRDGYDYNDE